jgi:predicted nucleic acid-binding protein
VLVIDTNILAYLLIEGDQTKNAQALFARDADWRSDAFLLIEFSNILVTYRRVGSLTADQAEGLLAEGEKLIRGLVNVPHSRALQTADQFGVAVYDARFLAAAQMLNSRLVTEDAKLRAAAPAITMSLANALTGSA